MDEHRVSGSGGTSLYARSWGDPRQPAVVLVHGYPDTSDVWSGIVPALAERFFVVTYDVRGAGRSQAGWMFGGYALERLVDDLRAVIDVTVPDGKQVHLVGHDWGAIQSWEAVFDERTKGRIASLTAFGAPCLDHAAWWMRNRVSASPRKLAELVGQLSRSWYVLAFHAPLLAPLAWKSGAAKAWPWLLRLEGVKHPTPSPTQGADGAQGVWLYRSNFAHKLLHPREARTDLPVQTVVSHGDPYVSAGLYEELAARVPNLWRRDIPKAGHWTPLTHASELARWIGELVDHVEARASADARASLASARTHARADASRPFDRRVVVVTGAGSGIGEATALAFAALGADVVCVDRDGATATRTAERCGARARAYVSDVADRAAMEALARDVMAAHGVPYVVVNNAGIGLAGAFLDTSLDDFQRVLDVNLWGVIHGAKLFGDAMAKSGVGGHIVNVASLAAYLPSRTLSAYCTSKAAVLMLSECMRAELAASGVKVSAICPGIVNTNITRTTRFVGETAAGEAKRRDKTSALYERRNFGPEGVARAIVQACLEDRAMVPVTVEAKLFATLGRLSPDALRLAARIDPS